MTSSPQRSTGVDSAAESQPPAVDDEVTATTNAVDPAESDAATDDPADEAGATSLDSDSDAAPSGQAPSSGLDDGPATDPHGSAAVPEGPPLVVPPPDPVAGSATAVSSGGAQSSTRVRAAVRRTGKVRKARLRLLRVEPWSVMKSAFVLSIAIGITLVVAVATLWSVVDAAGVFEIVGGLVTDLTESESEAGIAIDDYIGFSRVVGLATVIAVVDVVLLTALATLFAFLYNLSAALLGGFEITLAEDD